MKIEIKERKLTAGNRSLYLEYYETGFRKKENLHLYLVDSSSMRFCFCFFCPKIRQRQRN